MSAIRLRITLNKGRHGILINKLAKIAEEAEKFFDSFSSDLGLNKEEWIADNFKNSSVIFTVNYVGPAEAPQIKKAREALAKITDPKVKPSELNGHLSARTYAQFARLASPIDADDYIGLGVENDKGRFVTRPLTKERATAIERYVSKTTREFASFQGSVTALFKNGTCWIVDYLTNERVVGHYKRDQYKRIWKLLEKLDGVANVEGWAVLKNGVVDHVDIEHIAEAADYQEGDLDKFFGADPNFTGDQTTQQYLDDLRGEKGE